MIQWRPLTEDDLPALRGLAERVLEHDGGHPTVTADGFLRSRFLATQGASRAAFDGDALVAAVGTRTVVDRPAAIGLVDPSARTGGLGAALVDWALPAHGPTRFETEALTDAADALLTSRGLRLTFAEDVMAFDLSGGAPTQTTTATLTAWSHDLAGRFFAVYEESFRERPGFPGWSQRQWVDWHTGDDEFAPEWTLLATRDGRDVGFIACAHGAWVVQVGVAPSARGTGIGAALTAEALRRMFDVGEAVCFLDVNTNNPGAAHLYRRLGFRQIGRRARYERG